MTTTAAPPTTTLPCPHCHEEGASVSLCLSSGTFTCLECEAEVTEAEVEEAITALAKWRKVFAWASQIPTE